MNNDFAVEQLLVASTVELIPHPLGTFPRSYHLCGLGLFCLFIRLGFLGVAGLWFF